MVLEKDRTTIEWTPNTIQSTLNINGDKAAINLSSSTPNLKEYQMKEIGEDNWVTVDDNMEVALSKKRHEFMFRTLNLADVTGPEHKIWIISE
jgi:hypothetical protein